MMEKPVSMRIEEFKNNVVQEINRSKLPAWCLEPVIKDVLTEIHTIGEQQKAQDRAQYEKALEKENDDLQSDSKKE